MTAQRSTTSLDQESGGSEDSTDGLPDQISDEIAGDGPPEEELKLRNIPLSDTSVSDLRVGPSGAELSARPVWEPETPAAAELHFQHGPVDIYTGLDAEAARRLVDQLNHCLDVAAEYEEEDDG